MYPELLRLGPVVVSSYGVLLAAAFLVGIFITTRLTGQKKINHNEVIHLILIVMVSAIIGSRLLYVVTHLQEFEDRWEYIFLPVQADGTIGLSGLIFLGGLIAAVLCGALYVNYKKLPFWKIADSMSPALAFGLFLGRAGCFLNGCCFGLSCDRFWTVSFPPDSPAGYIMGNTPLHPTQIYSSLYSLAIFFVLIRLNRENHYDGFISGLFLVLYGIARFTVDFFRYYESEMIIMLGLDLNQLISAAMMITGIVVLLLQSKKQEMLVKG